jgi:hypothetical protein
LEDRGTAAREQGRYDRFRALLFFGADFEADFLALLDLIDDFFAWLFCSAAFFARDTVE